MPKKNITQSEVKKIAISVRLDLGKGPKKFKILAFSKKGGGGVEPIG